MKKSAGILIYRYKNEKTEVLLCHMGGPYWKDVDNGGWSLPKGEVKEEKVIKTAIREFFEETGFSIDEKSLTFLGSKKQKSNKLVIIFTAIGDYDISLAKSNTFLLTWPKGSKQMQEFPEMDKFAWIELTIAKEKILKGQRYFIDKLENYMKTVK